MPHLKADVHERLSKGPVIWSDAGMRIISLDTAQVVVSASGGRDFDVAEGVCMLFCLRGRTEVKFIFPDRVFEDVVPENHYSLCHNPGGCCFEYAIRNVDTGLFVGITMNRLMHLLSGGSGMPEMAAVAGNSAPAHRVLPVTPLLQAVVHQILMPVAHGSGARLFFQAKILELASELMNSGAGRGAAGFNRADRQIVRKAMALLTQSLETPPSIGDLASHVGVSASKIKQLFPMACGMTPYAYLRKLRMEKALMLLCEGEMNVTEVAYDVGYNSISHFTKVFFQYHGLKPSQARSQKPSRSGGTR